GQAEKEFKVEVEAIGRVRHKNLVRLLGYCAEGEHRLLYLHEGLEPKVVHRDIKSSNILLDKQWTPKVSDFGLAKLLGSGRTYVTTRVMGTFGFVNTVFCNFVIHGRSISLQGLISNVSFFLVSSYVAPEYASTGLLNCNHRIISVFQVNLVDWLKTMVSNRNSEGVLDPKIPEKPSSRALKRTLLVALRCVDPDSRKRPKMGHIIHMLEVDDFPYRDVS
ncbi:hypothetical protein B296_00011691, partial [Ensete ventricosum]